MDKLAYFKGLNKPAGLLFLPNTGAKRFSLGFSFSYATPLFVEEIARSLNEKGDAKALYTSGSIRITFSR